MLTSGRAKQSAFNEKLRDSSNWAPFSKANVATYNDHDGGRVCGYERGRGFGRG